MANKLTKTYQSGANTLTVLSDVSFEIAEKQTVSIVGPSGSGKTTLLGLCAGLDDCSSGSVQLCGQRLENLDEDARAALRSQYVGFIFQNFQLIPTLTALENVTIPMELQGRRGIQATARQSLNRVGLGDRTHHYPSELSGGEQQRVSLARAFSAGPKILFADEPTGNLDDETGAQVEQLLFDLNRESGTTLVIVTHDLELAGKTGRIIRLKGGQVISDTRQTKDGPLL
ncbi:MAG: ABC transporter ATP-binding protein [Saprospiraceae bacterium]|nr:ABC transporter ATP-binding protein [Saprospiraceae bacterium]